MLDFTRTVSEIARACEPPDGLFQPNERSALLIEEIRANRHRIRGARALEIGCGSGVALAALAGAGARAVCGVDIDRAAVRASARTMDAAGCAGIAELWQGDLWAPVWGRGFDVIVADLPQFPCGPSPGHSSDQDATDPGPYGRDVLDRFLDGLAIHLAPSGFALVAHAGFVDMARTAATIRAAGLGLCVGATTMVPAPARALRAMPDAIAASAFGRSVHFYGQHAFMDMHVLEIGRC